MIDKEYMDMVRNITDKKEIYPFILRLIEENLELLRRLNCAQKAYEEVEEKWKNDHLARSKYFQEAKRLEIIVEQLNIEIDKLKRKKK